MKRQESEMIKKAKGRLSSATGVTMVELLVVVAIITILSGVAFIAVWNYQRSMGQLERDNIAKEIFIAAQNHLTVAKGEGYRGVTDYGTMEGNDGNVYYYIVTNGTVVNSGTASSGEGMFAQMLPFGSIDETIRTGGSYLIRYQPKAGLVLDVFYCSTSGSPSKFNHRLLTSDGEAYDDVLACKGDSAEQKRDRRTYEKGGNSILGWYGGEDAANLPSISLKAPSIEVFNGDTLYVKVTDAPENKGDHSLKLILTGNLSGAQKSFVLKKSSESSETVEKSIDFGGRLTVSGTEYDLLLDDITKSGMHFRTIPGELKDALKKIIPFIPGEDVTVQAVAYSTSALANTVYSESKTTNSLFAAISDNDADDTFDTATISSIRHLENLSRDDISVMEPTQGLNITRAEQITDLSWKDFQKNITGNETGTVSVYYYEGSGWKPTHSGGFKPINRQTAALAYDGNGHSISDIKVDAGDSFASAGLFGTCENCAVSNLQLIDFDIASNQASSNAGTLGGSLIQTVVTNVIAKNQNSSRVAGTASVGGLIGQLNEGTVQYSAAAVIVNGGTNAGGLIGKVINTGTGSATKRIVGCFSGGHTADGSYEKWVNGVAAHGYDVTGATAGGLIGDAGNATISDSYSTCSVSGTSNAGGFVGSADGSISKCYATGLMDQTKTTATKFAFVGSGSPSLSENYYYSVINQIPSTAQGAAEGETEPMLPYSGYAFASDNAKVKPLDLNAEAYNTFTGAWDNWNAAEPYDTILVQYYSGKYPLKAIKELDETLPAGYFVSTHYGDWPSPEVFFINTK